MNKQINIPFPEFVTLMALYVALMAMAIDMMLPALSLIGSEFNVINENETQYLIGILFFGFTVGQVIYGPIADSFGRKFTIYIGLVLLIIGDILCLLAHNFTFMLVGRFIQGFGAASPRITSLAVIRDCYKGQDMARVMSFIMTIFIIIPVIAPSIGQAILLAYSWRFIFAIFLVSALIAIIWTYNRLPETLKESDVRPFNIKTILKDFRTVFKNKITMNYTICSGLIFGALIGYLTSSRQIFQDYFGTGKLFSLYFGLGALSIGISSIINSELVKHYKMKAICHNALIAIMSISFLLIIISSLEAGHVTIWQFMIFVFIVFFCIGLLFGNLNALAMEPMGHIAGVASTVIGFLSSAISVIIGTIIGQSYNNTPMPLIISFLVLASLAFFIQRKAEE
jgi:DHA1 family bicyclomycin/chloramphenicol resistance-like MFS transporter